VPPHLRAAAAAAAAAEGGASGAADRFGGAAKRAEVQVSRWRLFCPWGVWGAKPVRGWRCLNQPAQDRLACVYPHSEGYCPWLSMWSLGAIFARWEHPCGLGAPVWAAVRGCVETVERLRACRKKHVIRWKQWFLTLPSEKWFPFLSSLAVSVAPLKTHLAPSRLDRCMGQHVDNTFAQLSCVAAHRSCLLKPSQSGSPPRRRPGWGFVTPHFLDLIVHTIGFCFSASGERHHEPPVRGDPGARDGPLERRLPRA